MTSPDPQLDEPGNLLHDARDALAGALRDLFAELGWGAERVDRWPPRQPVSPAAWPDVPTLSRQPDPSGTEAVVATWPLVVTVDGEEQAQVQQQDLLLSRGWDLLAAVTLPGQARVRFRVQTVGPAEVDVGGAVVRGVVFSVQVRLLVRTLCPQRITSDS